MELNVLSVPLFILVCPFSMSIMMWKMNKNMDDHHMQIKPDELSPC